MKKILSFLNFCILLLMLVYILKFFYIFYFLHPEFVNVSHLPTGKGVKIIVSELWLPILIICAAIGSFIPKNWSWFLWLFVISYSIFNVVLGEILSINVNIIEFIIKLILYFIFLCIVFSKISITYFRISFKTTHIVFIIILEFISIILNFI